MSTKTAKDVLAFAKDRGAKMVSLRFTDFIGRWRHFVAQVERGYDDSIYEYTNDLSVRDRLARVVQGAGAGLRGELERVLADDDGRFEAATEASARPLGAFGEAGGPWWWRRVPRRRGGELAEDLESLGDEPRDPA